MGKIAGRGRNLPLLARADLSIAAIECTQLFVDIDNTPPNHANIVNWPDSKDERIAKAQELARVANLQLPP